MTEGARHRDADRVPRVSATGTIRTITSPVAARAAAARRSGARGRFARRWMWPLVAVAAVAMSGGCGDGGCGDEPEGDLASSFRVRPPFRPEALKTPSELAIGERASLPDDVQAALDHRRDYAAAPTPHGDDWLITNKEPGQTFTQWERGGFNRPDARRHVLYLQPLGELPAARTPPLADLAEVVHAYFQLEVRVLPAVDLATVAATARTNPSSGKPQVLAPDVLRWLRLHVPEDAYALMAVTMTDLYPDPAWNFVYGLATFTDRVGVQSFARYDPAFYDEPRPADWRRMVARRSAQVLLHEIGHMFGLYHCIYWSCVMAGANHQGEFDAQPLHACPVELRKLWVAVGFDVAARETALAAAWQRLDQPDEAAWSTRRAERLRAVAARP